MSSKESTTTIEEQIDNNQSESTHSTDPISQESHIYGDGIQGDKVVGDKVAGDKHESQFFVSYHVQMAEKSSETTRSVEIELTREQERRIRPEVIQNLVSQLQQNQLLIINDHPQMDKQEIVDHLIWGFQRSYQKLPVWLWSEDDEDVEEFNLADFLALQKDQLSKPGIFIFREVFPSDFERTDWSYFQSAFKERQQYLILTPSISLAKWQDSSDANAFQADIPENVFDPLYLVEELQTALTSVNVDELPQTIAQNIQTPNFTPDLTLDDVAIKLSSPTNIHVFVARLRYLGNEISKDKVTKLIIEVHQQKNSEKIYYLYKQLNTDQHKLLAAGLCLFGDLDEINVFLGLKRVIQGPWRQMFPTIGILDYFHLDPLYYLWNRQDNRIVHRQPNQRRSLLKFAWQSYQYHICEALPQLVPLVEDSVKPRSRPKTETERQRDRALRITISDVIGDVGQLSVFAVESILLQLASHPNFGVQATAARAMAQWVGQSRELEIQLFELLQRWQRSQCQQIAEFPLDNKNIQLTVARTAYYILLEIRIIQLPDAMPSLLWELFFNQYEEVRKYFGDSIQSELFPRHIEQIIRDWMVRLPYLGPASNTPPDYWVNRLVTFGYICDQHGQLDKIALWLIRGLARSAQGIGLGFQTLTGEHRHWLAQRVFPYYFRESRQLLLTLLQEGSSGSGMVDVFVLANQTQQQDVIRLLSDWRNNWQKTIGKQDEAQKVRWSTALPTIGMIYGAINEFQSFTVWLTVWLEQSTWQQYAEIVTVLVQIHRYQTSTLPLSSAADNSTTVIGTQVTATPTLVETYLYDLLIDSKAEVAQHQVALLFWNELQQLGIAKRCVEQVPSPLSGIIQLATALLSNKYKTTIRNLLPVARIVHQTNAGIIRAVIKQWRVAPRSEMHQIATDLEQAVRVPNAHQLFEFFLKPLRLLAKVVQPLYPEILKLMKWILVGRK